MEKRILWIEDDARELSSLIWPLEDEGYQIDIALNATQAVEMAMKNTYDVIILDVLLPTGKKELVKPVVFTGVKVIEYLRKKGNTTPTIALTVVSDPDVELELRKYGVLKIINKGSVLPSHIKKEVESIIMKGGLNEK
jgi:DNA-binding response OmpR family regulator